jgi:hypothetical protein
MDIRGINLDSLEYQISSMVRDIQGEFQHETSINLKEAISINHASFEDLGTINTVERQNA